VFRGLCLTASVVFTDYTGENVEITLVGRDALTRKALRFWANYIFNELGCQRLTARTSEHNWRMASLMERLGFTCEGEARCYYPDQSGALLYGMLKEECPWF